MTISERIKTLLQLTGNTQKSLADLLHVQPSTVNTWIKGNAESIPSSFIMPLCRNFGIVPEELLEGKIDDRVNVSDTEKKLLDIFRSLNEDSQILVMAKAIAEQRLMQNESEKT